MKRIIASAIFAVFSLGAYASLWHFPLYLDGGTPAKNRLQVEVSNIGEIDAVGGEFKISAKELGLVGKNIKSIRILSENNRELLWSVQPETKKLKKNSQFIIPVDCKVGKTTKIWVYYNNPTAYEVPDYYVSTKNFSDSFEKYDSVEDSLWEQKDVDENHKNLLTKKHSRTGKKCVHTHVEPNSKPSWIAVKKQFNVSGGLSGTVSMYVKGENIQAKGKHQGVGFYVALFGKKKPTKFIFSERPKEVPEWTKFSVDVKIPEGYTRMNVGTIAYINGGDAYFDDIDVSLNDGTKFSYVVKKPEKLTLKKESENAEWDVSPQEYDVRFTTSIYNLRKDIAGASLGYIPIKRIVAGNFSQDDFALFRGGKKVPFMLLDDILLFTGEEMQPRTEYEYSLYLKRDRKNQIVKTGGTKQASYIMSDQKADTRSVVDFKAFERMLNSPSNMVKNSSFEEDLNGWYKRYTTKDEANVVDGGIYGKKALSVKIDKDKDWFGIHKDIKNIQYGKNYICAVAVNVKSGVKVNIPRVRLTQKGKKDSTYFSKNVMPSNEWQIHAVTLNNNVKDGYVSLGLINHGVSEFLVDGVLFAECYRCEKYKAQTAFDLQAEKKLTSWQVNSVVKVFPFYAPPLNKKSAEISLAKNEAENLQIAVRATESMDDVQINVSDAVAENGATLNAQDVGVAKYVIVDSKSNYHLFSHFQFHERCIPPNSMAELYPDPIIPQKNIDLKANKTESVWLTFQTNENTKAGVYKGKVEFVLDGKVVETIPYSVRVFDFALPKQTSLLAIFDKRSDGSFGGWRARKIEKGIHTKFYNRFDLQKYLATKRVTVNKPTNLKLVWKDGKYETDFTEFDEFCKLSFEELGVPMMYLNMIPGHAFALPLPIVDKEKPYVGEWPYSNVKDYTVLRPEYIERVKARIKLIYDHIREKGWQHKFILFMSDEPYYWQKNIADMLNTYFKLIHSVAPEAKIYTSTWGYAEPIEKDVDIWGLSMSSAKTAGEIEKITKQKKYKVFTTDGNYCIDTPYNAQERIMAAFCYAGGFLGYEYWGVDWHMRNHLIWGIHKDRLSTPVPNVVRRNRFPHGDGYFIYSGEVIGRKEIFSSVRMEVVRDGQEDYEYFILLEKLAKEKNDKLALATLEKVKSYAVYPNPGARNSTELLPNPDAYTIELRNEIASHITRLLKNK
ncbi:MAG: DUF4091 domain-containing protein [Opitutales bacterium]|nr:DUF4091 domain-containing protein [Opitutales bacterium]